MPKRTISEKIEFFQQKIQKLKERDKPRRQLRRIIYSDSDDDSDHSRPPNNAVGVEGELATSLDEIPPNPTEQMDLITDDSAPELPQTKTSQDENPPLTQEGGSAEDKVPDLDADFLLALGDPANESPTYGENIHSTLADRWLPILRSGLIKENKEKLMKELTIPGNCKLLRAPTLNPKISAAITEAARSRDKKLQTAQQQLGLGITAINRAMSLLFSGDDKECKLKAIKHLSDSCRILSDLHFMDTQSRIKLITPALERSFLNIIEDMERDESLFGAKLSDKIKACKAIEKQSLQIKKGVASQKTATPSTSQPTTRFRYQGNWTAPSRFHQPSNRGGRGGAHRTPTVGNIRQTAPARATSAAKSFAHNKQRAPPRH